MPIEHLKMIQGIINRMAQVSFILKGWSLSILIAMLGVAASTSTPWIGIFALLSSTLFGGLDAYYLRQERLFRCLYEKVRLDPEGSIIPTYSMDTNPCKGEVGSWWKILLRPTIVWFYGTLIVISVIATALL